MRTQERELISFMAPNLPRRIPSLDGWRALSILCVVVGHSAYSLHAPALLKYFHHLGNFGVRCFFLISGLLITTLLLKEKQDTNAISLKRFYFRRVLRILPASLAYICVIAVLAGIGLLTLKPYDLLHAVTYTMNYHHVRAVWLDHLWSLSVEEQFYLLWPSVLVIFGMRRSAKIVVTAILITPVLRLIMWFVLGASESAMTKHFEANADALATGCLLAMSHNWLVSRAWYDKLLRNTWFWPLTLGFILVGNLVFLASPAAFYLVGQTMANIGTVFAIHWTILRSTSPLGCALNYKPLMYVGTLSYSLYLWQNFFLNSEWVHWPGFFPLNVFCSFGLALLSYYVIERPFLQLKPKQAMSIVRAPDAGPAREFRAISPESADA